MLTAEKVIKEIYHLPLKERKKIARHIIEFGIRGPHPGAPDILDIKAWQDEIASKPFNLKQASEYLGVSSVTLRRWVKAGRVLASKVKIYDVYNSSFSSKYFFIAFKITSAASISFCASCSEMLKSKS